MQERLEARKHAPKPTPDEIRENLEAKMQVAEQKRQEELEKRVEIAEKLEGVRG